MGLAQAKVSYHRDGLTGTAGEVVGMLGQNSGLNEGIKATEQSTALAIHAPKGMSGGREQGDSRGEDGGRLHGCDRDRECQDLGRGGVYRCAKGDSEGGDEVGCNP